MNISKHGIYVEHSHSARNGKTFQAIPNRNQVFATLTRFEDYHIVWLVVPFYKKEIKQLKEEGWKIKEVWRKDKMSSTRRISNGN